MPGIKCTTCGHWTNSATSNYWLVDSKTPMVCYVRWVDGKPEKGCGYEKACDLEKALANTVLKRG